MNPLILSDEIKKDIDNLVAYAEMHPFTMDDILGVMNGEKDIAGNREGYTIFIPVGYKVVYSIEQQPSGDVRHLSISVDKEGKLPDPNYVRMIMTLIGFENDLTSPQCHIHFEQIGENHEAVNVLELKSVR